MTDETPLQNAQNRVAKAALAQPMNPHQATIGSYINGILQSARITALTELWLNPPNDTWTRQEALNAAILKALNEIADRLEQSAQAVQIAQAQPKLHLVS